MLRRLDARRPLLPLRFGPQWAQRRVGITGAARAVSKRGAAGPGDGGPDELFGAAAGRRRTALRDGCGAAGRTGPVRSAIRYVDAAPGGRVGHRCELLTG